MKEGIAILVVGIAMVLGGAFWMWKAISKKKMCSAATTAVITGIKRHGRNTNKKNAEYYPLVRFDIDGVEYNGEADVSSIIRTKYKEGNSLAIKYNPADPNVFTVSGKLGEIKWGAGLILIGILMIVVYFI